MPRVTTLLLGVAMGYVLSGIGFSRWDEVHAMFTFSDLRMLLAFGLAVGLLVLFHRVSLKVAPGRLSLPERPIHPGSAIGGVLFGVGWSLSGACPSIALVQLGEGQLAALYTLAGIFGGNYLYSVVHERYLRWDVGSCLDE